MPRVIYTRGQLFLRGIWPRGQKNTLSSGRVSTVTGTVDTRRFPVFFVVCVRAFVLEYMIIFRIMFDIFSLLMLRRRKMFLLKNIFNEIIFQEK
jgi:hypothetical protein